MSAQEHPGARAAHALSLWSSVLALGCDLGRISFQFLWLAGRNRASTVACRYFEPASDFATQPVGRYTAIAWQIAQLGLTVLVVWTELPAPTSWLSMHWQGTGKSVGLWHTGALQMLLSVHLLSAPGISVYGNSSFIWWRFITGWLLLAIGFGNLLLGMIVQGDMRELRHQAMSDKEFWPFGGTKKYKAKRAWRELENTFDAALWPIEEDKKKIDEIRKRMGEALDKLF